MTLQIMVVTIMVAAALTFRLGVSYYVFMSADVLHILVTGC